MAAESGEKEAVEDLDKETENTRADEDEEEISTGKRAKHSKKYKHKHSRKHKHKHKKRKHKKRSLSRSRSRSSSRSRSKSPESVASENEPNDKMGPREDNGALDQESVTKTTDLDDVEELPFGWFPEAEDSPPEGIAPVESEDTSFKLTKSPPASVSPTPVDEIDMMKAETKAPDAPKTENKVNLGFPLKIGLLGKSRSKSPEVSGKTVESEMSALLSDSKKSRSPESDIKTKSPSDPKAKKRSRSPSDPKRSKSPLESKIKRSRSRSRSKTKTQSKKSRSKSPRKKSRSSSKSRSRSPHKKRGKSRSRSSSYSRTKSRKRERSRSRSRKSRSRSPTKRSRGAFNKTRSRSRSRSPHYRDRKRIDSSYDRKGESYRRSRRSRSVSPSRSHRRRSHSRSPRRGRSRSPRRDRYKHRSRSRSRSERYKRRSRSRSFSSRRRRSRSRSRSRSRGRHRRSRSKSKEKNNSEENKVIKSEEPMNNNKPSAQDLVGKAPTISDPSNKRSLAELTEFCKKLTEARGIEAAEGKGVVEEKEDEEEDTSVEISHPFLVAPKKDITIPPVLLPPFRLPPPPLVASDKPLTEQFPVSCGTKHHEKEHDVDNVGHVIPNVDGSAQQVQHVFMPPQNQEKLDISGLVVKRMEAQRRLQADPNDVDAMLSLQEVEMKLNSWCHSNVKPGQFTGQLAKTMMPKEKMNSGYQAWARKDMFRNLNPVSGGIGQKLLQKMGWEPGQVLGKRGQGMVEPIALTVKVDRKGLSSGTEKPVGKKGGSNRPIVDLQGKHPISTLQEYCARRKWQVPDFTLIFDEGPPHSKQFLFKVAVNGYEYQHPVVSSNKKHAKAQAAVAALKGLGLVPEDTVY